MKILLGDFQRAWSGRPSGEAEARLKDIVISEVRKKHDLDQKPIQDMPEDAREKRHNQLDEELLDYLRSSKRRRWEDDGQDGPSAEMEEAEHDSLSLQEHAYAREGGYIFVADYADFAF